MTRRGLPRLASPYVVTLHAELGAMKLLVFLGLLVAVPLLTLPQSTAAQESNGPLSNAITMRNAVATRVAAPGTRTRTFLAAGAGAALGALAGYAVTNGACSRCDNTAPMWFGAAVGAVAGAAVGVAIVRQQVVNPAMPRGRASDYLTSRLYIGMRLSR